MEKQRGTERSSPSVKTGEYFTGSFVFGSFGGSGSAAPGESEGAAPKSRSIGDCDRR